MQELKLIVNFILQGRVIDRNSVEKETTKITVMGNNKKPETLIIKTDTAKKAMQRLKITNEQYLNMISQEVPYIFKKENIWKGMKSNQKLTWHLDRIAHDLGAVGYEIQWL